VDGSAVEVPLLVEVEPPALQKEMRKRLNEMRLLTRAMLKEIHRDFLEIQKADHQRMFYKFENSWAYKGYWHAAPTYTSTPLDLPAVYITTLGIHKPNTDIARHCNLTEHAAIHSMEDLRTLRSDYAL
jgi:hypothetical protein